MILAPAKRFPIWESRRANLQFFFADFQILVEWVWVCGINLQKCRFDPYVGTGLMYAKKMWKTITFFLDIFSFCKKRLIVIKDTSTSNSSAMKSTISSR